MSTIISSTQLSSAQAEQKASASTKSNKVLENLKEKRKKVEDCKVKSLFGKDSSQEISILMKEVNIQEVEKQVTGTITSKDEVLTTETLKEIEEANEELLAELGVFQIPTLLEEAELYLADPDKHQLALDCLYQAKLRYQAAQKRKTLGNYEDEIVKKLEDPKWKKLDPDSFYTSYEKIVNNATKKGVKLLTFPDLTNEPNEFTIDSDILNLVRKNPQDAKTLLLKLQGEYALELNGPNDPQSISLFSTNIRLLEHALVKANEINSTFGEKIIKVLSAKNIAITLLVLATIALIVSPSLQAFGDREVISDFLKNHNIQLSDRMLQILSGSMLLTGTITAIASYKLITGGKKKDSEPLSKSKFQMENIYTTSRLTRDVDKLEKEIGDTVTAMQNAPISDIPKLTNALFDKLNKLEKIQSQILNQINSDKEKGISIPIINDLLKRTTAIIKSINARNIDPQMLSENIKQLNVIKTEIDKAIPNIEAEQSKHLNQVGDFRSTRDLTDLSKQIAEGQNKITEWSKFLKNSKPDQDLVDRLRKKEKQGQSLTTEERNQLQLATEYEKIAIKLSLQISIYQNHVNALQIIKDSIQKLDFAMILRLVGNKKESAETYIKLIASIDKLQENIPQTKYEQESMSTSEAEIKELSELRENHKKQIEELRKNLINKLDEIIKKDNIQLDEVNENLIVITRLTSDEAVLFTQIDEDEPLNDVTQEKVNSLVDSLKFQVAYHTEMIKHTKDDVIIGTHQKAIFNTLNQLAKIKNKLRDTHLSYEAPIPEKRSGVEKIRMFLINLGFEWLQQQFPESPTPLSPPSKTEEYMEKYNDYVDVLAEYENVKKLRAKDRLTFEENFQLARSHSKIQAKLPELEKVFNFVDTSENNNIDIANQVSDIHIDSNLTSFKIQTVQYTFINNETDSTENIQAALKNLAIPLHLDVEKSSSAQSCERFVNAMQKLEQSDRLDEILEDPYVKALYDSYQLSKMDLLRTVAMNPEADIKGNFLWVAIKDKYAYSKDQIETTQTYFETSQQYPELFDKLITTNRRGSLSLRNLGYYADLVDKNLQNLTTAEKDIRTSFQRTKDVMKQNARLILGLIFLSSTIAYMMLSSGAGKFELGGGGLIISVIILKGPIVKRSARIASWCNQLSSYCHYEQYGEKTAQATTPKGVRTKSLDEKEKVDLGKRIKEMMDDPIKKAALKKDKALQTQLDIQMGAYSEKPDDILFMLESGYRPFTRDSGALMAKLILERQSSPAKTIDEEVRWETRIRNLKYTKKEVNELGEGTRKALNQYYKNLKNHFSTTGKRDMDQYTKLLDFRRAIQPFVGPHFLSEIDQDLRSYREGRTEYNERVKAKTESEKTFLFEVFQASDSDLWPSYLDPNQRAVLNDIISKPAHYTNREGLQQISGLLDIIFRNEGEKLANQPFPSRETYERIRKLKTSLESLGDPNPFNDQIHHIGTFLKHLEERAVYFGETELRAKGEKPKTDKKPMIWMEDMLDRLSSSNKADEAMTVLRKKDTKTGQPLFPPESITKLFEESLKKEIAMMEADNAHPLRHFPSLEMKKRLEQLRSSLESIRDNKVNVLAQTEKNPIQQLIDTISQKVAILEGMATKLNGWRETTFSTSSNLSATQDQFISDLNDKFSVSSTSAITLIDNHDPDKLIMLYHTLLIRIANEPLSREETQKILITLNCLHNSRHRFPLPDSIRINSQALVNSLYATEAIEKMKKKEKLTAEEVESIDDYLQELTTLIKEETAALSTSQLSPEEADRVKKTLRRLQREQRNILELLNQPNPEEFAILENIRLGNDIADEKQELYQIVLQKQLVLFSHSKSLTPAYMRNHIFEILKGNIVGTPQVQLSRENIKHLENIYEEILDISKKTVPEAQMLHTIREKPNSPSLLERIIFDPSIKMERIRQEALKLKEKGNEGDVKFSAEKEFPNLEQNIQTLKSKLQERFAIGQVPSSKPKTASQTRLGPRRNIERAAEETGRRRAMAGKGHTEETAQQKVKRLHEELYNEPRAILGIYYDAIADSGLLQRMRNGESLSEAEIIQALQNSVNFFNATTKTILLKNIELYQRKVQEFHEAQKKGDTTPEKEVKGRAEGSEADAKRSSAEFEPSPITRA